MKKLLLFLMFLATPTYAIETAVVGTMWKQVGTVVSPADDVTSVTGAGGGVSDGDDVTFGSGVFNLDATDSVYINASTVNHTGTDGALRIDLVPDADSVRAIQTTINANGHNDIMAHSVDYVADGMSATDQGMVLEANITDGTATGGNVAGLWVTDDTTTGVTVSAIHAGTNVAPIAQLSGVEVAANTAFTFYSTFANVTSAFNNVSTNIPIFSEYSSFVYFGHTAAFSQVTFTLATSANTSILPDHEFWNGSAWTDFGPNDTTGGLTSSGHWSWNSAALVTAGWVANTVNSISQFYTRAIRTAPTLTTVPTESKVEIVTGVTYGWDSEGNITATSITVGAGSVGAPSIPIGDDNSGLYSPSVGLVSVAINGINRFNVGNTVLYGTNSFAITTLQGPSATIPVYSFQTDTDTGINRAGDDQLSLISGGVEALRNYTTYSEFYPSGAGQVRIYDDGTISAPGAVAFSGISTATVDYVIGNFVDDPTFFIECDATLGNISTTLPPVADKKGRLLEIKLVSAANGCYVDGNGAETIDGATGQAITTQYNSMSLIAGSLEWLIY